MVANGCVTVRRRNIQAASTLPIPALPLYCLSISQARFWLPGIASLWRLNNPLNFFSRPTPGLFSCSSVSIASRQNRSTFPPSCNDIVNLKVKRTTCTIASTSWIPAVEFEISNRFPRLAPFHESCNARQTLLQAGRGSIFCGFTSRLATSSRSSGTVTTPHWVGQPKGY